MTKNKNNNSGEKMVEKLQNKIKNHRHWLGVRCGKCDTTLEAGFGWNGWYQSCPKCKTVYSLNNDPSLTKP